MSTPLQHLYKFGPYRLDIAERQLWRDGEKVPLTPKAFEMLVALVERSGHLVAKDELMKLVWSDTFVEDSNLTNNVYELRKLLGKIENGGSYIETVPKRGYRFTAPVTVLPHDGLLFEKRTLTRVVTEETVPGDSPQKAMIVTGDALAGEQARPHTQHRSKWRWLVVALSSLSLGIAGFLIYRSLAATSGTQIESIAVLPFRNESRNPDAEYLSDGVTESLINRLSQLPQLKVIARNSTFEYKDKDVDLQEVARALGVQAILVGRVAHRGDGLVVSVELVDARDRTQVWGERYSRNVVDIQAVQEEMARTISEKLRVKLTGAQEQQLTRRATKNPKAYELYLKGRYHVLKLTQPENQKGVSYYQQAIAADPSYALAYFGLAQAHSSIAVSGEQPATEWFPKAKAATLKALELDDQLAEAHASLGYILFWYELDWNGAEDRFRRALELNPNSAETHMGYALLLSNTGRHAEALAEIKRAREHDPLNLLIAGNEGQFLLHAGQADEALDNLRKTLELDPNFWFAHMIASSVYAEKGMYPEAVAEARKAKGSYSSSSHPSAVLIYALAKSGKRAEARAELEGLLRLSKERNLSPFNIALAYNGLGETDEAVAWLWRGVEQRDPKMTFLKVEPKWNNLRSDPRFQDLLRRVGFTS